MFTPLELRNAAAGAATHGFIAFDLEAGLLRSDLAAQLEGVQVYL
ncbi:hypothetical protein [Xanthomonas arboricola]|uniref:Uncharacterized protein n=2 Tax=Xanthomonas arboricola pv. pruni TaxID=69929 RepID=A0AAP4NN02_9XANT|nr:hypothetical protein [Xanthomonas arboricola]MDN0268311.1 hypothetical protein [Xanthomonas arboricola pv. pruni]MDN0272503.1 hypothetical protein [Xanthomonas arboricola pv. pruni]MDN0276565.1 hypothetical protein [Xanthomonas arboricola pv. pruni]MDN0284676.1 hypothetical protein [Xanthomonas arboricola pv. pruni]MDN0288883.1 hypothetical protein [Xanthomonas arboricola pv. pruni]